MTVSYFFFEFLDSSRGALGWLWAVDAEGFCLELTAEAFAGETPGFGLLACPGGTLGLALISLFGFAATGGLLFALYFLTGLVS